MFSHDQYELIDFGDGRKLERFGANLIDRPCPTAIEMDRLAPDVWANAGGRFTRRSGLRGVWHWDRPADVKDWGLVCPLDGSAAPDRAGPEIHFQLRATPAGQVGVFPEQAANWGWIAQETRDWIARRNQPIDVCPTNVPRQPKVLNLFAYTGGSTLAAASAGAEVVHIDGARNVVNWARVNAEMSGMQESPIRWIAEDAARFVTRELKRGKHYDGIILDPPSYGHGPKGQPWVIHEHLFELVRQCFELMTDVDPFLLLTCHTPEFGPSELRALVEKAAETHHPKGAIHVAETAMSSQAGGTLPSGVTLQWIGDR